MSQTHPLGSIFLLFFALLLLASFAVMQTPASAQMSSPAQMFSPAQAMPGTLDVWPGLAPGETAASPGELTIDTTGKYGTLHRLTRITKPQIAFYPAPDSKTSPKGHPKPTVLVCPGGGYYLVTTDIEGAEVARWLNGLGYNAAVLFYRVPDSAVPSPARRQPAWQDAQRAMSLLRMRADTLGIDPHRLGVIGFSAGGHLAARLACGGVRTYPAVDAADTLDFRPDFGLLIYPAYLWDKSADVPAPEVAPQPGMPPLFLMQTRDDDLLDADKYAAALQRKGIAAECHIYQTGGHGYGLRLAPSLPSHGWPDAAATWLREQAAPVRKK